MLHRGWLEKKGGDTHIDASNVLHKERHYSKGGRRNWKRRWFILFGDGQLHYYSAEPADGENLPKESAWKRKLDLVGVEPEFQGQVCRWHVREGSDEFLLALPSGGGADSRHAMLLRHEEAEERQRWMEATTEAFGSTVDELLFSGETRGMAETAAIAMRTLLAAKSSSSQDVVSQLPPSKALAMFDFAAEQPGDLGLRKGMVVDLLETEGEWWKGSDAEAAGVVGIFPATFVSRGTASTPAVPAVPPIPS